MIKINLPIHSSDLSNILYSAKGIIDMELAEKFGCSMVVGTIKEIEAERKKYKLKQTSLPKSTVGPEIYVRNINDDVLCLPLHNMKSFLISNFLHSRKRLVRESGTDLTVEITKDIEAKDRMLFVYHDVVDLTGKQNHFIDKIRKLNKEKLGLVVCFLIIVVQGLVILSNSNSRNNLEEFPAISTVDKARVGQLEKNKIKQELILKSLNEFKSREQ